MQKMMPDDGPKAFLNAFKCSAWVAMLVPSLLRPTHQAVDTLPRDDITNYSKVRSAI